MDQGGAPLDWRKRDWVPLAIGLTWELLPSSRKSDAVARSTAKSYGDIALSLVSARARFVHRYLPDPNREPLKMPFAMVGWEHIRPDAADGRIRVRGAYQRREGKQWIGRSERMTEISPAVLEFLKVDMIDNEDCLNDGDGGYYRNVTVSRVDLFDKWGSVQQQDAKPPKYWQAHVGIHWLMTENDSFGNFTHTAGWPTMNDPFALSRMRAMELAYEELTKQRFATVRPIDVAWQMMRTKLLDGEIVVHPGDLHLVASATLPERVAELPDDFKLLMERDSFKAAFAPPMYPVEWQQAPIDTWESQRIRRDFVPAHEAFWTLPMLFGWIVWRNDDAVRRFWNEARFYCMFPYQAATFGDVMAAWADRLLDESCTTFPNRGADPALVVPWALNRVSEAVLGKKFRVFAYPVGSTERVEIPGPALIDIDCWDSFEGSKVAPPGAFLGVNGKPRYTVVRVLAKEAMEVWPASAKPLASVITAPQTKSADAHELPANLGDTAAKALPTIDTSTASVLSKPQQRHAAIRALAKKSTTTNDKALLQDINKGLKAHIPPFKDVGKTTMLRALNRKK